ncbi:MAG: hypothetical protein HYV28_11815, partial [Ignavibacteriales bacterium]|nr:hypothetical protein [Ignavibacteriales bacterium]
MKKYWITTLLIICVLTQAKLLAQVSPDYIFGDDNGSGWNWVTGTQAENGPGKTFKWVYRATGAANHYFKFGETASNLNGMGFWMNSNPGDMFYTGGGAIWTAYFYSNMGSNGAVYFSTTNNKYYVVKAEKHSSNNVANFSIMELSNTPVTVLYATDNYKQAGQQVDVKITLSGSKSSEENIYVRYTDDGWASSGFALASGSGDTYYATIPGGSITGTENNQYYIFTTTVSNPTHDEADLITINYNNNYGNNYRLFSKTLIINVLNLESTGQGPFMFSYKGAQLSCTWADCPDPAGWKSVVAYTQTHWSESDTTHNKLAYPCFDCSGATGIGAKTFTACATEQTNVLNDTSGIKLFFSPAYLTGFQPNCPTGDMRVYTGSGGNIKVAGVTKLAFLDFRFVLNVNYSGGITGDAYAQLDTSASDPRWLEEFDPFHSGQVQLDFSSFSAIVQNCYASFNAQFNIKPSNVTYHQSSAIVPHEGSAIDDVVSLPVSKVSYHFSSAVYGNGSSNMVYANQILAAPDGTIPASVETISSLYWQLSTTLSSYTTSITFDLTDISGIGEVNYYRILRRNNSSGTWTVWSDFTLLDANHIRANNVTTLGEWAIGTTKRTLNITAFIQSFYNPETNKQVRDTVTVLLRSTTPPTFSVIDSAAVLLDTTGSGTAVFTNTNNGVSYYLVIKHRNAVETWSDSSKFSLTKFNTGVMTYSFTDDSSKAFGNNLVKAGAKWCMYGGDVNQDGYVDFTDLTLIDNDAYVFSSGYLLTA